MTAKRTDRNQADIVNALRTIGATVESLHAVGGGVPDLLVGYNGATYLIEVKTATGRLNQLQREWHAAWRGQVAVCRSVDEAIETIRKDLE
jgi:Holliday junction resolvase